MEHNFIKFPELTNSQMTEFYFISPHKQIFDNFTARVEKVTDGDTIRVSCNFRDFNFPIRFAYIDAAELNEGGERTRDWLKEKILGEEVDILINNKNRVDKWGRLLGQVVFMGEDLGEAEIREGRAVLFGEEQLFPNIDKQLGVIW